MSQASFIPQDKTFFPFENWPYFPYFSMLCWSLSMSKYNRIFFFQEIRGKGNTLISLYLRLLILIKNQLQNLEITVPF